MPTGRYLTSLLAKRYEARDKDCDFVFPARGGGGHLVDPRDAMDKISERAGVRFIMSDLRRTFATHSAAIGIHYFDIKRLLNHKVDNREATPGYIVAELERKRVLVQRLEDYLMRVAGIKETPVLPFAPLTAGDSRDGLEATPGGHSSEARHAA